MDSHQKKLIAFFFVLCTLTLLAPLINSSPQVTSSPTTHGPRQSTLQGVHYYVLNKLGHAQFLLATTTLKWDMDNDEVLAQPANGQIFQVLDDPITFKAAHLDWVENGAKVVLQEAAELTTPDARLAADRIVYKKATSTVQALGQVDSWKLLPKTGDQISIKAPVAAGDLAKQNFTYTQGVAGEIKFKRTYLAPVNFQAQEVAFTRPKMLITMQDEVELRHKNVQINAWQGEIFLENYHQGLQYYSLDHNVHLVETAPGRGGQKKIVRQAYAEQLDGWPREGKIVLTGMPQLLQDNSLIKGRKVTFYQNKELVEVEDATTGLQLESHGDDVN